MGIELPDVMESYECVECGNTFFVEFMEDVQDLNRPCYRAYCGLEFEYYLDGNDG